MIFNEMERIEIIDMLDDFIIDYKECEDCIITTDGRYKIRNKKEVYLKDGRCIDFYLMISLYEDGIFPNDNFGWD